jgi:hypothetical protein
MLQLIALFVLISVRPIFARVIPATLAVKLRCANILYSQEQEETREYSTTPSPEDFLPANTAQNGRLPRRSVLGSTLTSYDLAWVHYTAASNTISSPLARPSIQTVKAGLNNTQITT